MERIDAAETLQQKHRRLGCGEVAINGRQDKAAEDEENVYRGVTREKERRHPTRRIRIPRGNEMMSDNPQGREAPDRG